jgi:dolichol-phosphate mannosyltransferase
MRLSVGIPVHNEQDVLPELLSRLTRVLDDLEGGPHEVVFVDDGSTDGTRELLITAAAADPRIVVVVLSRNFGHQAAMGAALDHASGDSVVLMDGDLQDEPEVIPRLVALHRAGADIVYTTRASREEGRLMRASYAVYYRVLRVLADLALPLDSGDFALLGPEAVAALRSLPERQRYLRGLRTWIGFTQVRLDVPRRARAAGRSKYTPIRLLQLAIDGVCSFSTFPLRAAVYVGIGAVALSCTFSAYTIYARLTGSTVPTGFTASLLVTTFLSGVQLMFLGIIGEYVGRVYGESKGRPPYIVAKVTGRR